MSGYFRSCVAGLALVGGLSATPAFSDPFADLFNSAPREPAATASPQAECLPQPGNSSGEGLHWVYRRNGHRKCWFLTEDRATVQKPVHRRVINRVGSADENETVRRKGSSAVDARAELQRSAPAEGAQLITPAREAKVADAASVFGTGTTALMPAPPVSDPPTGQLTPEHSVPPQVEVEKLLPAASEADAAAMPVGMRVEEAGDDVRGWTATWAGLLLMVLGVVSVLSSSRVLREAVLLRH